MKVGDLVRCKVEDGEGVGVIININHFTTPTSVGHDVKVIWANNWGGPYWYRSDELVKV
jgi:hypothetical protein